ncbi:pentapeptide repeat-containing protein [Scytonema sp. NUACC26]|uniref:pentapeptide repeat-containing protein n=1 Tax=Scytonema sp. NUACC26 TaxID=3140176 RepID=UPI0034DC4066
MTLPYSKKRQKHRTQLEEEILHLRRTGRYIPPPRTSWMKSLVDVVEKRYIEPLANLFERADIFKIAEKLGIIIAVVSALVGVLFYVLEARDRKERSILEAWQVVKDGKDEKSGVIVLALQRLHREGFRLVGINLKGTNLSYVTLIQANLRNTNFSRSDLSSSNL